jgi:hypothetical protein
VLVTRAVVFSQIVGHLNSGSCVRPSVIEAGCNMY